MVRKSARFLAPIALAAAITATYLVVHKGLSHKTKTTTTHVPSANHPAVKHRGRHGGRPPRVYVVRPGDSLSTIAAKTEIMPARRRTTETVTGIGTATATGFAMTATGITVTGRTAATATVAHSALRLAGGLARRGQVSR